MYEELVKCSDLLMQFGGHPMAAGLSMEEKNVELFRRRLNDNCTLTEQDLIPKIMIDVPMPISYLSKKLTEQLKVLEPFGKGNSKPLFAQKNLRAVGIRVFGRNRNVAKMLLIDGNGIKMDAYILEKHRNSWILYRRMIPYLLHIILKLMFFREEKTCRWS